jgi:hypothetical protein
VRKKREKGAPGDELGPKWKSSDTRARARYEGVSRVRKKAKGRGKHPVFENIFFLVWSI